MFSNEAKYILERAITERMMAKAATHPKAVVAHEELASLYDKRLIQLTRPTLHIAPEVVQFESELSEVRTAAATNVSIFQNLTQVMGTDVRLDYAPAIAED